MPHMSLQDMRDFVRTHLDSDTEELPNGVLDRFIQDGSNRIENYTRHWSFRAVEYSLAAEQGVQSYDLDTVASLIDPTPLRMVTDVRGPTETLDPTDHRRMRAVYSSTAGPGTPRRWSLWGRHLYLWPTPAADTSFTVIGYREGIDWIDVNQAPDFPDQLHELIAFWALNRAYAMLDDPQMASFYREEFASELRGRAKHYTNTQTAPPLVMGGGHAPIHESVLAAPRWPW